MVPCLPILGPRIATSPTVGSRPLALSASRNRGTQGRTGGRPDYGHSGSSVVGGRADRKGRESLELGKCRGLLQELLTGLTLAPALEMQAGVTGQAWATPSPSSLGPPPEFPELQAGFSWAAVRPHSASLGTSEASARQMGHVRLAFNHLSTHLVWNSWLQGRTRRSCRTSKSLKQTTHSVCSD